MQIANVEWAMRPGGIRIGCAYKRATAGLILAALTTLNAPTPASASGIFRWDDGTLISGTSSITPGPFIDLSKWNKNNHNLRYADLAALDLPRGQFHLLLVGRGSFQRGRSEQRVVLENLAYGGEPGQRESDRG